jgi:hypothetical protein
MWRSEQEKLNLSTFSRAASMIGRINGTEAITLVIAGTGDTFFQLLNCPLSQTNGYFP